jgi:amino acid transporter
MSLSQRLFGRPLRSDEEDTERIGVLTGVAVLGLDALASASYGPEAALTGLIPLGHLGSHVIVPISISIVVLLWIVALSYYQTIAAYPDGGGSFTVAKTNLSRLWGLVAAAALCVDYIINVAVAISAGVGVIVSAVPPLLPYTLTLTLLILALLTIVNLRGIRTAGLVFLTPTYAFVLCLGLTVLFGLITTFPWTAPALTASASASTAAAASGAAASAAAAASASTPAPYATATMATVGWWLLLRSFASGCTAMTGVEAVSNATPIFKEPHVRRAQLTLLLIVSILAFLVCGIALLCRAYGITATKPGEPGYQSVLSLVVDAVIGHGIGYFITMGTVLSVLSLSANTSFADFPRVCRLLALDADLPPEFAHRGPRLVYTTGIITLTVLAGGLLIAFGGITDRLIPLFAVGAFLAFTMSQVGMVVHWWRDPGRHPMKMTLNALGAVATMVALGIIVVSKFAEGAWLTVIVIPGLVLLFMQNRKFHERLWAETAAENTPLDTSSLTHPLFVIPLRRLDRTAHKALRFSLAHSADVYAVQVLAEDLESEDLTPHWPTLIAEPARNAGLTPPRLVVLHSPYREFYSPFIKWIACMATTHRDRHIVIVIPEVVHRRWYHFLMNRRETWLKTRLLLYGGPHVVVMNTPFYPDIDPTQHPGPLESD